MVYSNTRNILHESVKCCCLGENGDDRSLYIFSTATGFFIILFYFNKYFQSIVNSSSNNSMEELKDAELLGYAPRVVLGRSDQRGVGSKADKGSNSASSTSRLCHKCKMLHRSLKGSGGSHLFSDTEARIK